MVKKVIHTNEEIDITSEDKEMLIEQLMDLYTEKVYLLAYSFVKDRGIAEDISQEVFLKAYRYINNFRGEASLKSWIYRITVNTSMDFLKKKSMKQLLIENSFFESFNRTESAETSYLETDRNEHLLQIIITLPMKYRAVIVLHYFYDLTINELSTILNIKTNTVKTRLSRGRDMLRRKIEAKKGDVFSG
ncbi:sigma-70 family RNA polymerase sigma factor [Lysinibacillus sp. SGAir0095]|uniref:sigma-70 family RNA polymerase sigma factor n=1 Tax=Lysinibacillus sp. SGAir0095 TaxID=2070463 RepID=UPI0010CD3421|nr:sigma-70 family RNA polymerase sigma factor [Lysinibacillus sp. SGAir0095]QCR30817.1 RNA polymerase subunit sigma-24 [Lysinibacillus sp. SGAir0095]